MECSGSDRSELLAALLKLHTSAAAQLGAAPRHFMAAADMYSRIMGNKREQLLQQQQFLKVGVLEVKRKPDMQTAILGKAVGNT